jgi:outer membrane protein assembly factor BamB
MNKTSLVLALVLLTLFLLPVNIVNASYSMGEQVTITPSSADTSTKISDPATNYGDETFLIVDGGSSPNTKYGFIKFDLSSIPFGANIISAELQLFDTEGQGGTQTISMYRVTSNWSESILTWNTNPATRSTATASQTYNPSETGYHSWIVTADVQLFVTGTPNYGWCIKLSDYWVTFASKEGAANQLPKLVVTWSDDWIMFRHDASHTGYSNSSAPVTNATLWIYNTGKPVQQSPAVVSGRVYIPSVDKTLYCLDAGTGSQIWNYTTGYAIYTSPAVVDGKVYIGLSNSEVYCLNASTGSKIWNYTTGDAIWSSPAVVDGKVYIGSNDYNVYCLDASTGAKLWNYTAGNAISSSPAVADGMVYVGSADHNVYCLDASTGSKLWNYTAGHEVQSSPAVVNGNVYIGSGDYNVYCLNASTGAKIWNYPTGGYVFTSPAVANGNVYVVTSQENKIYCLAADTGSEIWNKTIGTVTIALNAPSPVVADGKVYVGSTDFNVYCLDANTGSTIWTYATGNEIDTSPAVAGTVVYIASHDGKVYAFGVATVFSTEVDGVEYHISTVSNSEVSGFAFNQAVKTINFNVTGPTGTTGSCNLALSKTLLGGPYTILIDGSAITHIEASNATHSFLYFTYNHSMHEIQIIGTTVIPELSTAISTILLLTILAETLFLTKRMRYNKRVL